MSEADRSSSAPATDGPPLTDQEQGSYSADYRRSWYDRDQTFQAVINRVGRYYGITELDYGRAWLKVAGLLFPKVALAVRGGEWPRGNAEKQLYGDVWSLLMFEADDGEGGAAPCDTPCKLVNLITWEMQSLLSG